MPDPFDYRVLVIAGLRDAGYSDTAACALVNASRDLVEDAYKANVPPDLLVRTLLSAEEQDLDEDTPLVVPDVLYSPDRGSKDA